jgi:hypothetical protein
MDPVTGVGRLYSIRYRYQAYWYVERLVNEIRITNNGDPNCPIRMPYHAVIAREYVYHNKNRNPELGPSQKQDTRVTETVKDSLSPGKYNVKVNLGNFE